MDFTEYCSKYAFTLSPATYEAVADFVVAYSLRNKGHTASLAGLISNLRTQFRVRQLCFLDAQGEILLKQLLAQMRLADTTLTNSKDPFRFKLILEALARLDLDNIVDLQEATSIMFAQNALLRTAEATGGLRAVNFIWKAHSVVVQLGPTKTVRSGAGVSLEVHESEHPLSGVRLLRRLWAIRNLDQHPQEYVFCQIDRRTPGGKLDPSTPASATAYRNLIKCMVRSIGLDPRRYSGHSLRAGGATDLFALGTPYYVVKKMGRWKSDAALLYFRSESDVARIAAKAFDH